MIRYNGLMQPCIMARRQDDPCPNMSAVRREGDYILVHLCAAHRDEFAEDAPAIVGLCGDDYSEATPLDSDMLFEHCPWMLEINGVTREEWELSR